MIKIVPNVIFQIVIPTFDICLSSFDQNSTEKGIVCMFLLSFYRIIKKEKKKSVMDLSIN